MLDNAPILISSAQLTLRDLDVRRSPVDAMQAVSQDAITRCRSRDLTPYIDVIATVPFIAMAEPNAAQLMPRKPALALAERLGCRAPLAMQAADLGGNTPQYLVNTLADRLARGRHQLALLCGAELMATFFHALAQGGDISHWASGPDGQVESIGHAREGTTIIERAHGLFEPINTYPLFESAIRHQHRRDFQAHQAVLGGLCSRLSAVAATNPHAWKQQALSATDITTVDERNRYIGFPYTRAMNAILAVDMAAAVLMTTPATARRLGIDERHWVYLRGAADLNDHWWVSERGSFTTSPALQLAAETALAQASLTVDELDYFDLYSCFPSALEHAAEAIGIALDDPRGLSLTGGMPFFGGPGNDYSLHAIAELTQRLRERGSGHGLVSAMGYYLTKHSLGVYSAEPPADSLAIADMTPLQARLDALPVRKLAEHPEGVGRIEAFTVAHDRQGPVRGIVIGSLESGERFLANTAVDDDTLSRLLATDPVGEWGRVTAAEPVNGFTF